MYNRNEWKYFTFKESACDISQKSYQEVLNAWYWLRDQLWPDQLVVGSEA